MLVEINDANIDRRFIDQAVKALKKGGVIIFPTDSVYAMGCSLNDKKALNKLAALKGVKLKKTNFSIICSDISNLSDYVKTHRPSYFQDVEQIVTRTIYIHSNGHKRNP